MLSLPGPLLEEIKQTLEETVSHTDLDRSLLLYSGHDVTLVALWRSLGFTELLEPEYGASIVLELHEDVEHDELFVKVSALSRTANRTAVRSRRYFSIETELNRERYATFQKFVFFSPCWDEMGCQCLYEIYFMTCFVESRVSAGPGGL